MARAKRSTESYLDSARELAKYFPAFKKFKRRKTSKIWEKSWIARVEKLFRFADHLIPVDKKGAKIFKDLLYLPPKPIKYETIVIDGKPKRRAKQIEYYDTPRGIQAIQFRNTAPNAKFRRLNDRLLAESNGRLWTYMKLPDTTKSAVRKAGEDAWTNPDSYDIEKIIKLAEMAFANPVTKGVFLWSESGRVGEGTEDLNAFVRWIAADYARYKNTDKWVRGIAILIADVDDKITAKEWASFGTKPVRKKKHRNRRRQ